MSGAAATRGAFILFEGVDRCGKTTQARRLVDALNAGGVRTGILGKYHVWSAPRNGVDAATTYEFQFGNNATGPGGCTAGASPACPDTDYNTVARNITHMRQSADAFYEWAGADAATFLYVGFGDSHRCGGAGRCSYCS
jgi:hypothetical protein